MWVAAHDSRNRSISPEGAEIEDHAREAHTLALCDLAKHCIRSCDLAKLCLTSCALDNYFLTSGDLVKYYMTSCDSALAHSDVV
jgi:hypothetical protein